MFPRNISARGSSIRAGISSAWKSQVGFVWDLGTFKLQRQFRYAGEGWAHNGHVLGAINLTGLLTRADVVSGQTDVLNGNRRRRLAH